MRWPPGLEIKALASHLGVSVLHPTSCSWLQPPANANLGRYSDGLSGWMPATHVGNLDFYLLSPGPTLAIAGTA